MKVYIVGDGVVAMMRQDLEVRSGAEYHGSLASAGGPLEAALVRHIPLELSPEDDNLKLTFTFVQLLNLNCLPLSPSTLQSSSDPLTTSFSIRETSEDICNLPPDLSICHHGKYSHSFPRHETRC